MALHGSAVVPVQALGLSAGNQTQGHRFEAQGVAGRDWPMPTLMPPPWPRWRGDRQFCRAAVLRSCGQLAAAAQKSSVAATKRRSTTTRCSNEVTGLVERPNVLVCSFESAFLDVPQECLILTMKANQKYFPLLDAAGKLHQPLSGGEQHQPG